MRILAVSDSHNNNDILEDISNINKNIDIYLHAGDSESDPTYNEPYRIVKGNCDYFYDIQEELIIPSEFGNILLRHKPNISVDYLISHQIKLFIYGHTHIANLEIKNGIIFINPGALSFPRDGKCSYAILNIEKDLINVCYYLYPEHKIYNCYDIKVRNGEIICTQNTQE